MADSRLLRLSLRIEDAVHIRIGKPRTNVEIEEDLARAFKHSHESGMELLRTFKELVKPEAFGCYLLNIAVKAAKGFKEEGVGEENFKFLLTEFCQQVDHEINRRFVQELLDFNRHDVSWAAWALDQFCKAFPDEGQYHKMEGDLCFSLGIYDCAAEAYEKAIELSEKIRM